MAPPLTAPIDDLGEYLAEAKRILAEPPLAGGLSPNLGPDGERLRWFPNPAEMET
jgi:hypothetical protein